MNILKKTALALMLSLGLMAQPQKAEAGIIIGFIAGAPLVGTGVGVGASVVLGITTGTFGGGDPFAGALWVIVSVPLVVLDYSVEGDTSLSQIENGMTQLLPMIDDREVIRALSKTAQTKFQQSGKLKSGEKRVIHFSEAEVTATLEETALSGAERETVKALLQ